MSIGAISVSPLGWAWSPSLQTNAEDQQPVRPASGAAGGPALSGQDPPPDQATPQRVQPGQEGQKSGERGQGQPGSANQQNLSLQEQAEVQELKDTDRKVRAHEAAHMAAGGQYVSGGVTFTYKTGPDHRQYAVGGEVPVDASPVRGDPQATINKAEAIARAAQAPADPSPQDRMVAAQAAMMEADARLLLAQQAQQQAEQQSIQHSSSCQCEACRTSAAQGSEGAGQDAAGQAQATRIAGGAANAPPPLAVRLRSLSVYA